MQMGKVSVIVPCYWATPELIAMTGECLESIGPVDELIIVDDGSPLDVVVPARTIRRKTNGGYAAAVNTGLQAATGDFVVIANNDVIFTENWLTELLKPLHEGYDISTIRTSNNSEGTEDKITEGDKFDAVWAMWFDIYESVGKLDETLGKGYFSDTDYKQRAEMLGYKIGKNHNCIVEHKSKATFKTVDPNDSHYEISKERYREKYGRVD